MKLLLQVINAQFFFPPESVSPVIHPCPSKEEVNPIPRFDLAMATFSQNQFLTLPSGHRAYHNPDQVQRFTLINVQGFLIGTFLESPHTLSAVSSL